MTNTSRLLCPTCEAESERAEQNRSALKVALRRELRRATEQSKQKPAWAKRRMPAITPTMSTTEENQ